METLGIFLRETVKWALTGPKITVVALALTVFGLYAAMTGEIPTYTGQMIVAVAFTIGVFGFVLSIFKSTFAKKGRERRLKIIGTLFIPVAGFVAFAGTATVASEVQTQGYHSSAVNRTQEQKPPIKAAAQPAPKPQLQSRQAAPVQQPAPQPVQRGCRKISTTPYQTKRDIVHTMYDDEKLVIYEGSDGYTLDCGNGEILSFKPIDRIEQVGGKSRAKEEREKQSARELEDMRRRAAEQDAEMSRRREREARQERMERCLSYAGSNRNAAIQCSMGGN